MGTQSTTSRNVRVGIMTKKLWHFILYKTEQTSDETVELSNGKILHNGVLHNSLTFTGLERFTLYDVSFAKSFHFGMTENQTFAGDLHFVVDKDGIAAINCLPIEEYLKSVISSEMNADCPIELLKAHAIISRSWLLHGMIYNSKLTIKNSQFATSGNLNSQFIKWYERDAHRLFDVCADDHCQRYQGITHGLNKNVEMAVQATEGKVLTYSGQICDTRYHKCCGGRTEQFRYVWADTEIPYLESVICPYCEKADNSVLKRVLNDFDSRRLDYFRWQVEYSQTVLSDLVKRKSGIDFGIINSLEPIERGLSGRISKLKIVGTNKTLIVGKELEIRYWLADTCLYSSNFEVIIKNNFPSQKTDVADSADEKIFLFKGKGWGHGVGLCQIGAAVMADKGFDYLQILNHYFPKSQITSYFDLV